MHEYEYDSLNERRWEHPSDYGGFSPDGDVVIAVQTRDSDALKRSNYKTIFKHLEAWEETWAEQHPDEYEKLMEADAADEECGALIYDFRAGHWAVGWVEQLLMSKHAPDEIQMEVVAVIDALADYPVFDEEHFSELEWKEAHEYWESMAVSERVEIIQEHGGNIFAARHDYLNENADPDGMVFDYLRTP